MRRIWIALIISLSFISPQNTFAQSSYQLKYNQLVHNYYRQPKPNLVPPTLQEFLASDVVRLGRIYQDNSHYLYAYTFGRLAQVEPSLIPLYLEIFKSTSGSGRRLMIEIFQICGNDDVNKFLEKAAQDSAYAEVKDQIAWAVKGNIPLDYNPLNYPIWLQQDLDMHWVEFFISGQTDAIDRIISVINRPDVLRQKVELFFQNDGPAKDKKLVKELLSTVLGVEMSLEEDTFNTNQDLGGILTAKARLSGFPSQEFQQLVDILNLDNEDIRALSVKGAAIWSLQSNARLHQAVLDLCEDRVANQSVETQVVLREIVARGQYRLGNYEKARDQLLELITLSPNRPVLNSFLAEVYLAMGDYQSANMQLDYISRRDKNLSKVLERRIKRVRLSSLDKESVDVGSPVENVPYFIKMLRQQVKEIKSFQSYAKIATGERNVIEWDFDYVAPDKFSVEQAMFEQGTRIFNKWLAFGDKLFIFMGVWVEDKERVSRYDETCETLRYSKWINSIPDGVNATANRVTKDDAEYILLEYTPQNINMFFKKELPAETRIPRAELWVDVATNNLQKGYIAVSTVADSGEPVSFSYEQEFFNINGDILVEVPDKVVKVSDLEPEDQSSESQSNNSGEQSE